MPARAVLADVNQSTHFARMRSKQPRSAATVAGRRFFQPRCSNRRRRRTIGCCGVLDQIENFGRARDFPKPGPTAQTSIFSSSKSRYGCIGFTIASMGAARQRSRRFLQERKLPPDRRLRAARLGGHNRGTDESFRPGNDSDATELILVSAEFSTRQKRVERMRAGGQLIGRSRVRPEIRQRDNFDATNKIERGIDNQTRAWRIRS